MFAFFTLFKTGALIKGIAIGSEISFTLFSAVFFLECLKKAEILSHLAKLFSGASQNKTLLFVILCFLFGSLVEGSSGFGSPLVILVPLLIELGLSPLQAASLPLLATVCATPFGALGVPVALGFDGLAIPETIIKIAYLSTFTSILIPFFIERKITEKFSLANVKSFLLISFSFSLSALFVSQFGPEFPSLLGALSALIFCSFFLRKEFNLKLKKSDLITLSPYFFLIVLLVSGKLIFQKFDHIFALGGPITFRLKFFQPGFAFLSVGTALFIFKRSLFEISYFRLITSILLKVKRSFLILASLSSATQLIFYSDLRLVLESVLSQVPLKPLIPFIGALTSGLAGTSTVSNLFWGGFLEHDTSLLALEATGSAVGVALATQSFVTVSTLLKKERIRYRDLFNALFPEAVALLCLLALLGAVVL